MVNITSGIQLVIFLVVIAILIGSVFLSSVGLLANNTKGSACTNCQVTTKTMLQNTEIFLVFAVFLAIVGAAVGAYKLLSAHGKKE